MKGVVGLDVGSVSVKYALVDSAGKITETGYRRHGGRPLESAAAMLRELTERHGNLPLALAGSSGKIAAEILGVVHINELLAHAASTARLYPDVRTIIEMGGEDSKLIVLDKGAVKDFALNSVCAAGTGSFLDQQAERMRLTIEEFSETATKSKHPPRIAGRCSVFAKSDMIHLQQIATPVEDIVAGLCFSVARNFRGSIVRNRAMPEKVAFMGGVALNKGMVRAFRETFGLDELVIPEPPTMMGAAGAAFKAMDDDSAVVPDPGALERLKQESGFKDGGHSPLVCEGDQFRERHLVPEAPVASDLADRARDGKIPAYLGVDIGSISTCLAVVDEHGDLLSKRYLRTASRPIEAVLTGLREVGDEVGEYVDIRGVGTTGSGRYMIGDFISADVVKNEITAHAKGAAHTDPGVDTIFEIGGQDSKYIKMKDGVITDFEMNKACAAGTGSFLEEQAEKLSVQIKDEFASLALSAKSPCRLGERCTVFMENSLQSSLQRGAGKDDLLGGLAYSIVQNYINRVVNGRAIGSNIFFQGGTAFNKSVVAAFEKYLDTKITVPPHHDNTGAIGMALLARDHMRENNAGVSSFKGFDLADRSYSISSFECKGCENRCEINRVHIEGESGKLFYGGRCERYDIRQRAEVRPEDLFAYREAALNQAHELYKEQFIQSRQPSRRPVIGIPRVFNFQDSLPYYATLLWELGFEVVTSPPTDRTTVNLGVQTTLADTCFPIKVALGHVRRLMEMGIKDIFLPSFINMLDPDDPYELGHGCPLTQSFPYQARAAFPEEQYGVRFLAPPIQRKLGNASHTASLARALKPFRVGSLELRRAMRAAQDAQDEFVFRIRRKGRQALENITTRTLVIVGRSYNAFDPGVNLEIPKKLATLNVQCIPMDFLPQEDVHKDWPEMYWRSGQRLLKAARFVKKHPNLHPLFIGSFSCGPDSFIQKFFDKEMAGKPYLHIEIDEHSADAGVITRCEAFLDSLEMQERLKNKPWENNGQGLRAPARHHVKRPGSRDIIYLPRMCDHALGIKAAFQASGVQAEVMPETDQEAITLGRKNVSGKECYPFAVTTGDMLKQALAPDFDPARSAFFMPSGTGPCRFGQYNVMQRLILDRAGFEEVPIFSPIQDVDFYSEMGMVGRDFDRKSWEGVVAIDLLTKCLHETRPYERDPGSADELYEQSLQRITTELLKPGRLDPALLESIRRDFENLPRLSGEKPLIGVVGEIFVRSNKFSNENLIRKIEALGGEAWLAPVDEWVYYVNWGSHVNARLKREYKKFLAIRIKEHIQKKMAHALEQPFNGYLKSIHDPGTKHILANASAHLHETFRGEAVLSVGKAIDMIERGASGIVNAMPFGCMPGTIVTAILRRMSQIHNIPAISIPFDGTASPTMHLQLEAFMEQAKSADSAGADAPPAPPPGG